MPVRVLPATAACLLALALPAAALAQGAGDEQYSDPFGGQQEEPAARQTPAPTPAPAPASTTAQAAPTPTPVPAAPTPTPAAAPGATPTASRPQLPLTGADAGLLALAGIVLLAGGVALRVRLRGDH